MTTTAQADPNGALAAMRAAIRRAKVNPDDVYDAALEAMDYAEALDIWVSRGGALPSEWHGQAEPFDIIATLEGADLDYLREMLDGSRSVRVCMDGGLKVSADRGMWTLPLGELKA